MDCVTVLVSNFATTNYSYSQGPILLRLHRQFDYKVANVICSIQNGDNRPWLNRYDTYLQLTIVLPTGLMRLEIA